ncbi:phosphonate ABC transporter, permease protein PhnE [Evansella tamaricis]|uniref:Phosphonate ABC transporter, permease protein PhnE n=1 Tax=Evansella tamaricis TaxID=2069301 RepID=A0ABS6JMY1_9BACI|nr:phosphonate ABC transporter, permease protein PhnE [Evansella tamaricis]MBU9713678.1 phosphonate ABC transporter, permease protein PhnE [Evansella tamaricis]
MKENMPINNNIITSPSKTEPPRKKTKRDRFLTGILIFGGLFFIFSLIQLNLDYSRLISGTSKLFSFVGHMMPPDFSTWEKVIGAGLESLQIAIVGTSIGVVLALFLSFLAAENLSPHRTISWMIKGIAAFVRAIPALIWVLIFIVAVGMGPFPGILALAFNSLGMLVKVFAQSIEEIDDGVLEAMRSTGASWMQVIFQGVIPTVLTAYMSWSIFRLEIDFRYATILGMVGAGGIGWELTSAMRMYRLEEASFIILVIFLMVFTVEVTGNQLKKMIQRI